MEKVLLLLSLCLFVFCDQSYSQPTVSYQPVVSGFTQPVDVTHAGDARLFVAERQGIIKIVDGATILPTPFLDIREKTSVDGDRGLLSIAFHPNYSENGYFYLYYTEKTSDIRSSGAITIARYKVSAENPNVADPASELVLLTILEPVGKDGTTFKDHNGGDLNFGPDGKLYFGTGDGGKEAGMEAPGDPYHNSQNKLSLLGKLISLDVENVVPGEPAAPTIVALGLRNPWRWSFDRANGDIWIGDVGHYKREEVHYIANRTKQLSRLEYKPELNFGWSCYEGSIPYETSVCEAPGTYEAPVYEYINHRSEGGGPASVTGGFVYRGAQYPVLRGYYIAADIYSGEVHLVKPDGAGGWNSLRQPSMKWVVSFGEGNDGELYALAYNTGTLYKVTAEGTLTATEEEVQQPSVIIYPTIIQNEQVHISSVRPLSEVKLFNSNGSLLFQKKLRAATGNTMLDLPNLPQGVYLLYVTGKDIVKKQKLLVK